MRYAVRIALALGIVSIHPSHNTQCRATFGERVGEVGRGINAGRMTARDGIFLAQRHGIYTRTLVE